MSVFWKVVHAINFGFILQHLFVVKLTDKQFGEGFVFGGWSVLIIVLTYAFWGAWNFIEDS